MKEGFFFLRSSTEPKTIVTSLRKLNLSPAGTTPSECIIHCGVRQRICMQRGLFVVGLKLFLRSPKTRSTEVKALFCLYFGLLKDLFKVRISDLFAHKNKVLRHVIFVYFLFCKFYLVCALHIQCRSTSNFVWVKNEALAPLSFIYISACV